jgi:SAM-dependent methyltransferase
MKLREMLSYPLTRGLDIDDPQTTDLRRRIIRNKPFLKRIYREWYEAIASRFSVGETVLELGSGGGFLREMMPLLITSDVFPIPGVDRVEDARSLSFADRSLDGIVMTNVLHHIPDPAIFLREAERTLKTGGRIVMIEPWNNAWSRFVYGKLHHEPFYPMAGDWCLKGEGPLSDANGALPWILFARDRFLFEARFPGLRVSVIRPFMPFSYLLSGGVSMIGFMPGWAYRPIRFMEGLAMEARTGMFAEVVVEKVA